MSIVARWVRTGSENRTLHRPEDGSGKNRSQTLAAQRAEETRQQAANAWAAYRAGERTEYVTPSQTTLQDLGITVDPKFDAAETQTILNGASKLATAMGGENVFRDELGGVFILKDNNMWYGGLADKNKVIYNTGPGWGEWRVVRELAHAWDANHGWHLSTEMQSELGAGFHHPILHFLFPDNPNYWYGLGDGPPPAGVDKNFNDKEDFAEAVAAYLYPTDAATFAAQRGWPYNDPGRGYNYNDFVSTPRGKFIETLFRKVSSQP